MRPFSKRPSSLVLHDPSASPRLEEPRIPESPSSALADARSHQSVCSCVHPSTCSLEPPRSLRTTVEVVSSFFTNDVGEPLLAITESPQLCEDRPRSSRRCSVATIASSAAVDLSASDGTLSMPLLRFCDAVADDSELQLAEVVSTAVYTENKRSVTHRFVLLQLRREGKKNIWLRLDRRSGTTPLRLVSGLGSVPAHDTARLGADMSTLVGPAVRENKQVFETIPTLKELQYFLRVICQELKVYSVWPENCYFFCSLIQQHLSAENDGRFVFGILPYPDLAQTVRDRVKERIRQFYNMPLPYSATELLRSLAEEKIKDADVALTLSRSWDRLIFPKFLVLGYGGPYQEVPVGLCHHLAAISERLHRAERFGEASALRGQFVLLSRKLDKESIRRRYRSQLAEALCLHGESLREAKHTEQACRALEEAVGLKRQLYFHNPRKHHLGLTTCLSQYWSCLLAAGRPQEACTISEEDVSIMRRLYRHHPRRHAYGLAISLRQYNQALRAAGRLKEACKTGAEEVRLVRRLFERQRQHGPYQVVLTVSLRQYSRSLREAGRAEQAFHTSAEAVTLSRELSERHPGVQVLFDNFTSSLDAFAASLRAMGHDRWAELVDSELDSYKLLSPVDHRYMVHSRVQCGS